MNTPALIEKKRDGHAHTAGEIQFLIQGFTAGSIPDYQMSALAMAIYFSGMAPEETADLTRAMLDSGGRFHWPEGSPRIIDKHSTGGVGDKISLILAPLLACDDNCWVPMISGRGLGLTGGTLDKLESIPGFNVSLTRDQALVQLEKIGVAMMGQTADICPADKKLYRLRDVTGTVPSQPLIVASIMSKKLAESLDALVLDVKYGSGAFMKTRTAAESLASEMISVGVGMGVDTRAFLTPMDEPLGHAVGNALEVQEALETLRGQGPPDLVSLTLHLAAEVATVDRSQLETWLHDGTALAKFEALVEAQGGDLKSFSNQPSAPIIRDIKAPVSGTLTGLDADAVARAAFALGAGRATTDATIDFAVGFDRIAKAGATVEKNQPLARLHARSAGDAVMAEKTFLGGVTIE